MSMIAELQMRKKAGLAAQILNEGETHLSLLPRSHLQRSMSKWWGNVGKTVTATKVGVIRCKS